MENCGYCGFGTINTCSLIHTNVQTGFIPITCTGIKGISQVSIIGGMGLTLILLKLLSSNVQEHKDF